MRIRYKSIFIVSVASVAISFLCQQLLPRRNDFHSDEKKHLNATSNSPSVLQRDGNGETLSSQFPAHDIRFQVVNSTAKDMSVFNYDRKLPRLEKSWPYPPEQVDALAQGAKSRITLIIVDSLTNVVENARVQVFPTFHDVPLREMNLLSDEKGEVEIEDSKASEYYINIRKENHYPTNTRISLHVPGLDCVSDGKWQPWNPILVMTLKEIRKPGDLFHRTIQAKIPVGDVCFIDLAKGAFLPPHGDGIFSNMTFQVSGHKTKINGLPHYKSRWKIYQEFKASIPNGGGFIRVLKDIWSSFRYVHEAPDSGYGEEITELYASDGETNSRTNTRLSDGEYYIFRFCQEQDKVDDGYRYGMIIHPVSVRLSETSGMADVSFEYFLSTNANDRNLETVEWLR